MALIQTVDIFPPAVDDPYEYGLIAAANSLSDVWAMGGEARLCMNILMFPEHLPFETVQAILRGGYDKVAEAEAIVVGGHTIKDDIPKYGLCVSGVVHPDRILRNNSIQKGDVLILTKPLGTGVLTNADRGGLLSDSEHKAMVDCMAALNKYAADAVRNLDGVHACTDVTGFSLLGHSYEMAQGSDVELELEVDAIDLIPEALEFANMGLLPAGMYRNRAFAEAGVDAGETALCKQDLLYDPQTAGGLLMAVDPADAEALHRELQGRVPSAQRIGIVKAYRGGKRIFLR